MRADCNAAVAAPLSTVTTAASASSAEQIDNLRQCLVQTLGSAPFVRLALHYSQVLDGAAVLDAWATLAEAHAALVIDVADDHSSHASVQGRAHAQLKEYCTSEVLRTPSAVLASHEQDITQRRESSERRERLVRELDAQVRLRLALFAVGIGAGVEAEPMGGKQYKELKRLLQMLGLKLASRSAGAEGCASASARSGGSPDSAGAETTKSGVGMADATAIRLSPSCYLGVHIGSANGGGWTSLDDYVMLTLRPRFEASLATTICRVMNDFQIEVLQPSAATAVMANSVVVEAVAGAAEGSSSMQGQAPSVNVLMQDGAAVGVPSVLEATGSALRSSLLSLSAPSALPPDWEMPPARPALQASRSLSRSLSAESSAIVSSRADLLTHAELKARLARESSRQLKKEGAKRAEPWKGHGACHASASRKRPLASEQASASRDSAATQPPRALAVRRRVVEAERLMEPNPAANADLRGFTWNGRVEPQGAGYGRLPQPPPWGAGGKARAVVSATPQQPSRSVVLAMALAQETPSHLDGSDTPAGRVAGRAAAVIVQESPLQPRQPAQGGAWGQS